MSTSPQAREVALGTPCAVLPALVCSLGGDGGCDVGEAREVSGIHSNSEHPMRLHTKSGFGAH